MGSQGPPGTSGFVGDEVRYLRLYDCMYVPSNYKILVQKSPTKVLRQSL